MRPFPPHILARAAARNYREKERAWRESGAGRHETLPDASKDSCCLCFWRKLGETDDLRSPVVPCPTCQEKKWSCRKCHAFFSGWLSIVPVEGGDLSVVGTEGAISVTR